MRSTRSHFWNSSAKSCRFLIPQLNISKQYQCREPCFAWLIGHLSRGPEIISLRSITAAKKNWQHNHTKSCSCFFPFPFFSLSILSILSLSILIPQMFPWLRSHLPGVHEQVPGHPRQEAQGHDAWDENSCHGIRHTLHWCPIQLSGLNETHDLAQHRFAAQLLLGTSWNCGQDCAHGQPPDTQNMKNKTDWFWFGHDLNEKETCPTGSFTS